MADRKKQQPSIPPEPPEDLRRQDPRPDRPASLPESEAEIEHGGISPSLDGDNPDHPIHDEDTEDDLEPDDFERMADELENSGGLKIRKG